MQASGRLVKMKLPATSATVRPEHPVGCAASSTPRKVMTIPGSGDSIVSDSTTRPKNEVVTGCTESVTLAVCVEGRPSMVAAAETVRMELPVGCPAGAVTVRIEICPAVICCGAKDAVTPEGNPLTLSFASCVKPSALSTLIE